MKVIVGLFPKGCNEKRLRKKLDETGYEMRVNFVTRPENIRMATPQEVGEALGRAQSPAATGDNLGIFKSKAQPSGVAVARFPEGRLDYYRKAMDGRAVLLSIRAERADRLLAVLSEFGASEVNVYDA